MIENAEQSLEAGFAQAISGDLKFSCVAFRKSIASTIITEKEIVARLKTIYTPAQIKGLNRELLVQLTFEELCVRRVYPQLQAAIEGKFTGPKEKIESVTMLIEDHIKNVKVV